MDAQPDEPDVRLQAADSLTAVLAGLEDSDVPVNPVHAAYLRGAADALRVVAGQS